MTINASQMSLYELAVIHAVRDNYEMSLRLMELGFRPFQNIRMTRKSWTGSAMVFMIGNKQIALRKEEADMIQVKRNLTES